MAAKKSTGGGKTVPKKTAKPKPARKTPRKKAAGSSGRAKSGSRAKPKSRRAKRKPRSGAAKGFRFQLETGHVFYLFFALLPLLALGALNFNAELWTRYATFISAEDHPSAHLSYNLFCALVFFASPLFSLFVIRNTPVPASRPAAWFLILAIPVAFALDFHFFGRISPARMFVAAFVIEVLSYVAAIVLLRIISLRITILLAFYAVGVASSFYGVDTGRALLDAGMKSTGFFVGALIAMTAGFYRVLGYDDGGTGGEVRVAMSNVALFMTLATWCLAGVVLFAAMA